MTPEQSLRDRGQILDLRCVVSTVVRRVLSPLRPPPLPLSPYAPTNHHHQGAKSFAEQVLWPELEQLSAALTTYLSEITERVIREEVHRETGDADEVDEPRRNGR